MSYLPTPIPFAAEGHGAPTLHFFHSLAEGVARVDVTAQGRVQVVANTVAVTAWPRARVAHAPYASGALSDSMAKRVGTARSYTLVDSPWRRTGRWAHWAGGAPGHGQGRGRGCVALARTGTKSGLCYMTQ